MSKQIKTLVLALGNPLRGDDGVGTAVVDYLERTGVPDETTLLDGGTPGLETLLLMQGYDRVIVVDAADMNKQSGAWARFTPDMVRLQSGDLYLRGTLHYAGLAEALALGEAMNLLPPEILIFGIQPEDIGWTPGLSEPVKAAIPQVGAAIQEILYVKNIGC